MRRVVSRSGASGEPLFLTAIEGTTFTLPRLVALLGALPRDGFACVVRTGLDAIECEQCVAQLAAEGVRDVECAHVDDALKQGSVQLVPDDLSLRGGRFSRPASATRSGHASLGELLGDGDPVACVASVSACVDDAEALDAAFDTGAAVSASFARGASTLAAPEPPSRFRDAQELVRKLRGMRDQVGEHRALLADLRTQLSAAHGVDLAEYKLDVLHDRVRSRIAARGVGTLRSYVRLAARHREESKALRDELLIGSTSFFRDPEVFDWLRREAAVRWLQGERRSAVLRVWVPGCSTGEEVYSLAIVLLEAMSEAGCRVPMRIFATDLRARALAHASRGVYGPAGMGRVSAERRERFFVPSEGGFRVRRALRDAVVFAPHDALADPPFRHLDLLSCRNLLLYYERSAQERALAVFASALRPDGLLLLGAAERPRTAESSFAPVARGLTLYAKRTRDAFHSERSTADGAVGARRPR